MVGNAGFSSSPNRLVRPPRSKSRGNLPRTDSNVHAGNDEVDTSVHLNIAERWWRVHQPWLERCGYLLRSRYRQDWIPSWERKGFFSKLRSPEDIVELPVTSRKMDATRISDGLSVHLYLVSEKKSQEEVEIMLRLTSGRLSGDHGGGNHTIPVFEVLEVEDNRDLCVVVTPLMRACDDPWFENMGEAVNFLGQVLEGMKFMHAHGIAHRNPQLDGEAIVYDPTDCYPEGFHPVVTKMNRCFTSEAFRYSRTEKPVTYYFTDFRTAKRYRIHSIPPTTGRRTRRGTRTRRRRRELMGESGVRDHPLRCKSNFAPEFMRPENKCDPFKTDVYLLGMEISRRFLEKYRGFEWLRPLIDDMCREDPKLRVSAAEAYVRFLWLGASIDMADLDRKLISTKKRRMTQRAIRKLEKKLHVKSLLRELGLKDDPCTANPSLAAGVSWLPIYSV